MTSQVAHMGADKAWYENFRKQHAQAFKEALARALHRVEDSGVNLAEVFKPQEAVRSSVKKVA